MVTKYLPDGRGGQVLYTHPFAFVPTQVDPIGVRGLLQAQQAGPSMQEISSASLGAQELIRRTLCFDEHKRPTARDCLAMSWFTEDFGAAAICLSRAQINALEKGRENRLWWRAMAVSATTQLPASKTWTPRDVI